MQMNLDLAKEIIGNIFIGQGYIDYEKDAWEFICKELEAVKTSHNTGSQKCTCYVLSKGLCIPGERMLSVNKNCPQHGTLLASA